VGKKKYARGLDNSGNIEGNSFFGCPTVPMVVGRERWVRVPRYRPMTGGRSG